MKKTILIPCVLMLVGCSGIASEATRDRASSLTKPPFSTSPSKQKAVVEIYSKATCPFCVKAKELLDSKKVHYTEHDVNRSEVGIECRSRSNGRNTVPQIFIDGKHVGGFDDLKKANDSGELDKMLSE